MLSKEDVFLEGPQEAGEEEVVVNKDAKKKFIHSLRWETTIHVFMTENEKKCFRMRSPTTLSSTPSESIDDRICAC